MLEIFNNSTIKKTRYRDPITVALVNIVIIETRQKLIHVFIVNKTSYNIEVFSPESLLTPLTYQSKKRIQSLKNMD